MYVGLMYIMHETYIISVRNKQKILRARHLASPTGQQARKVEISRALTNFCELDNKTNLADDTRQLIDIMIHEY